MLPCVLQVMLINNNFMSRIPMYTSGTSTAAAATMAAPVSSVAATVYSVSGGRNGTTPSTHSSSFAVAEKPGISTGTANGYNRTGPYYSQAGGGGEAMRVGGGKSLVHTNPTILPSHSHFTHANNNTYKAVYDENGMRIDRTPTDDEINNLWKNMRTMLDVGEGKGGGSPPASTNINSSNSNEQAGGGRQTVQVSHQYIDGASLGIPNGMGRVIPGYTATTASAKSSPPAPNGGSTPAKLGGQQTKNGYLQRYSLLQQRRNPTAGMGALSRANGGVVEQTVHPMPLNGNGSDPRHAAVNISYAPREESELFDVEVRVWFVCTCFCVCIDCNG